MSRIGKQPIPIPKDVKVDFEGDLLTVRGPKGELNREIHPAVNIQTESDQIVVSVNDGNRKSKALHGLFRALIANMVTGVSQGFEKALEIVGVGYRAELSGRTATFHLGYSHPIKFELPDGVDATVDKNNTIRLSGIDKEKVGHVAAAIRRFRPPEPYKGKGVKYAEERIIRKAGKTGTK